MIELKDLHFFQKFNEIIGNYGMGYHTYKEKNLMEEINRTQFSKVKTNEMYHRVKFEWMENMLVYTGSAEVEDRERFKQLMGLTEAESEAQYKFKKMFSVAPEDGVTVRKEYGTYVPAIFGCYNLTSETHFEGPAEEVKEWMRERYPEYKIIEMYDEKKANEWYIDKMDDVIFGIAEKVSAHDNFLKLVKELNELYDKFLIKV